MSKCIRRLAAHPASAIAALPIKPNALGMSRSPFRRAGSAASALWGPQAMARQPAPTLPPPSGVQRCPAAGLRLSQLQVAGAALCSTSKDMARQKCLSLQLSLRMCPHLLPCSAALGDFCNDPQGQACDLGKDVPFPQVGRWSTAGQALACRPGWISGLRQPCQQASAIVCAPEEDGPLERATNSRHHPADTPCCTALPAECGGLGR